MKNTMNHSSPVTEVVCSYSILPKVSVFWGVFVQKSLYYVTGYDSMAHLFPGINESRTGPCNIQSQAMGAEKSSTRRNPASNISQPW